MKYEEKKKNFRNEIEKKSNLQLQPKAKYNFEVKTEIQSFYFLGKISMIYG